MLKEYEEAPISLYKYRGSNSNNIDALLGNKLYVPRTDFLNDISELSLYSSITNTEVFEKFITLLRKGSYILSFGTENNNMMLWNLYCDSFKGYVLEYSFYDLINIIKKQREGGRYGFVKYSKNKKMISTNFMEKYKSIHNNNITVDFESYNFMFIKSFSWKEEKEYRIVFSVQDSDIDFINKNNSVIYKKGFFIENIKPNKVIIGYKMGTDNKNTIIAYCMNNNIVLEVAKPNLSSKEYDISFQII